MTRDIEIKNNMTVTRREVGRDNGGKGGRIFRNNYKGHKDKIKRGMASGEGGGDGRGRWEVVGGKCRQLYLNKNEIII